MVRVFPWYGDLQNDSDQFENLEVWRKHYRSNYYPEKHISTSWGGTPVICHTLYPEYVSINSYYIHLLGLYSKHPQISFPPLKSPINTNQSSPLEVILTTMKLNETKIPITKKKQSPTKKKKKKIFSAPLHGRQQECKSSINPWNLLVVIPTIQTNSQWNPQMKLHV